MSLRALQSTDRRHFSSVIRKVEAGNSEKKVSLQIAANDQLFLGGKSARETCAIRGGSRNSESFGRVKFTNLSLPFFIYFVPAGFPSHADDPYMSHLDLGKYLIRHPKSTYYFKVMGYEMVRAGINPKDLLVVDTTLKAKHRDIILAFLNGEVTLRRLCMDGDQTKLLSANPDYPAITVTKQMSFFVQGVVTTVIRTFNPLPYDNHFKDVSYPHI